MKPKVYDILMDVKRGLLNNEIIRVVTGDYGMNRFNLKLLEDRLAPYNLQNAIVRIMVVTPSGSKQQQDLIVENAIGGSANITLKQSLFSESGGYLAEFQIFDETTQVLRLTTPRFEYYAVESLQDEETILASDEYSILQQLMADVGDINNNINTKIETHNAEEESHPHLIQQLNEIATDVLGLQNNVIVESGSNENGSYVKFGDGTMICYARKSPTTNVETSFGSLFKTQDETWVYPSLFIAIPIVQIQANRYRNTWGIFGNAISSSVCEFAVVATTSLAFKPEAGLLAVGRWKI